MSNYSSKFRDIFFFCSCTVPLRELTAYRRSHRGWDLENDRVVPWWTRVTIDGALEVQFNLRLPDRAAGHIYFLIVLVVTKPRNCRIHCVGQVIWATPCEVDEVHLYGPSLPTGSIAPSALGNSWPGPKKAHTLVGFEPTAFRATCQSATHTPPQVPLGWYSSVAAQSMRLLTLCTPLCCFYYCWHPFATAPLFSEVSVFSQGATVMFGTWTVVTPHHSEHCLHTNNKCSFFKVDIGLRFSVGISWGSAQRLYFVCLTLIIIVVHLWMLSSSCWKFSGALLDMTREESFWGDPAGWWDVKIQEWMTPVSLPHAQETMTYTASFSPFLQSAERACKFHSNMITLLFVSFQPHCASTAWWDGLNITFLRFIWAGPVVWGGELKEYMDWRSIACGQLHTACQWLPLLRRCSKIKRWILSRQVFTVSAIGPRGEVGGLHIVGGLPWRSRLMQMVCGSWLLQSPWKGSSAQAARHRQGKVLQQDCWAENQGCRWRLCSCCIKLKGIVKREKRILIVWTVCVWACVGLQVSRDSTAESLHYHWCKKWKYLCWEPRALKGLFHALRSSEDSFVTSSTARVF